MSHRVAASALVIALSLAFASTSGAEDMRSSHLRGKLTVPVTGLIAGGGSFSDALGSFQPEKWPTASTIASNVPGV